MYAVDALCCPSIITHVSSAYSTSAMNSMSGVCKANVFLHFIIMLHNKIIFTLCFSSKRILHATCDGELCELYATVE